MSNQLSKAVANTSRVFIFFFVVLLLYGVFTIVLSLTQDAFLPFVDSLGFLDEQGFVDKDIAMLGIGAVFVFIVFTYGAMLIYGFLDR